MYIYLYIYKKDKVTEGTSGLSCRGQVPFPRAVLETPLPWSVTIWQNDPVVIRPAKDGAPPVAGTRACCSEPCSRSTAGATEPGVSAEFPALLGTADVNRWKLQGEKEEEGERGLVGESNRPWRISYPFIVQVAVRGKGKPLVLLGTKKRWSIYDAEMPERCQGVSTKASLTSFTIAVTVSYISMVLFVLFPR